MPYEYTNPMWDEAAERLLTYASCLCVGALEAMDAQAWTDEARSALAERGYNIGIGVTIDAESHEALLRLTKAPPLEG